MKNEETKEQKRKAYMFLGIIALSTIIFLIVILSMVFENIKYKSYKDIARHKLTILGEEVFSLQEGDYYIYIYSSNDNNNINREKQNDLEPYIVNYFNFVKQNKRKGGVCEIRLMDVDNAKNARCLSNTTTQNSNTWTSFTVDEASLPILLYMTVEDIGSSSYSYTYDIYKEESQIKSALAESISLKQEVTYLPIENKKKYLL